MPYATPTEFRAYLPQVDSGADNDAIILDVPTRATEMVRPVVGVAFFDRSDLDSDAWPAATTKNVWSEHSVWLKLPFYKEATISLVTRLTDSTVIADYEERWDMGRGYLWREAGWSAYRYSVTAQWGAGPPPPNVIEITLEVAVNLWRGRDRGMFQEIQTTSSGIADLRYIGGLTKEQRKVLDDERNRWRDGVY